MSKHRVLAEEFTTPFCGDSRAFRMTHFVLRSKCTKSMLRRYLTSRRGSLRWSRSSRNVVWSAPICDRSL